MGIARENEMHYIVEEILADYGQGRAIDQRDVSNLLNREETIGILQKLLKIFFPGYYHSRIYRMHDEYRNLSILVGDLVFGLGRQVELALRCMPENTLVDDPVISREAQRLTFLFLHKIPQIREYVNTDLEATLDGDPAAGSYEEIVLAYPGLFASTVNRIAHELHRLGIPLLPRLMTEYAHSITGVDIHPGATIGKYFFIDHGTGVVIGETTVIGEHVKLYQGVTLGALSTRGGQKLKDVKRHPTIEDYVTIYSGASILGGKTVIGRGSVIGGNAFITSSVAPGSRISVRNQELQVDEGEIVSLDVPPSKEPWYYTI